MGNERGRVDRLRALLLSMRFSMQMLPEEETSSLVQSASLIGHPGLMLPGLESLWGGALSRTRALPIPGSPMSGPLTAQG